MRELRLEFARPEVVEAGVCVCAYYCRTYDKAVSGGGEGDSEGNVLPGVVLQWLTDGPQVSVLCRCLGPVHRHPGLLGVLQSLFKTLLAFHVHLCVVICFRPLFVTNLHDAICLDERRRSLGAKGDGEV